MKIWINNQGLSSTLYFELWFYHITSVFTAKVYSELSNIIETIFNAHHLILRIVTFISLFCVLLLHTRISYTLHLNKLSNCGSLNILGI